MNSNVYVLSCSYRSSRFAIQCIQSVQDQTLKPKQHIYIDDASDDDTMSHLYDCSGLPNLTIFYNDSREYKLKNLYTAITWFAEIKDDDIVCILDGDDWITEDCLAKVQNTYDLCGCDYLYTNWKFSHNGDYGISQRIPNIEWNPYKQPWITSAMSTFKAGLFRQINPQNFLDENGEFFKMACDQAYVLPMLEFLRRRDGDYRSVGFVNEPLYIYQFLENKNKPRVGPFGEWMAAEAQLCAETIRARGFIP